MSFPIPTQAEDIQFPLSVRQVKLLSVAWTKENAKAALLWREIRTLADRFLATAGDGQGDELSWHHLLLAVGNWKRQGGTVMLPLPKGLSVRANATNVLSFAIPGRPAGNDLSVNASTSWRRLTDEDYPGEEKRGMAVATATTLLSALWPGQHVILDIRDLYAAIGLLVANGQYEPLKKPGQNTSPSWDHYDWFLPMLRAAARSDYQELNDETPTLVHLERALFMVGDEGRLEGTREREAETWEAYGNRLKQQFDL